jgi:cytochrome c peroxidase
MHDGSLQTLKDVIDFYSDSVKWSPTLDPKMIHAGNIRLGLTPTEKADLLAFMNTMSDREISVNPKYTNPFYRH